MCASDQRVTVMDESRAVATVRRRTRSRGRSRKMGVVKWIVGIGYWMHGFRVFPTMGFNFFLKDMIGLSPWALQLLNSCTDLPAVAKPIYGILSDAVCIRGQHRLPYVAIGAILQAASWITLLALPKASFSVINLIPFLIVGNIGASVADVANDAIVAEIGKQSSNVEMLQLRPFTWIVAASAGALGNLVGGAAINSLSPRAIFQVFIFLLILQFFSTVAIHERSLDLPKKDVDRSSIFLSIHRKVSELTVALRKPEISSSITWFFISSSMIPLLKMTLLYYHTKHLRIHSTTIGISRVVGQFTSIAWTMMYCKRLKQIPARKVLSGLQVTMALLIVSNVLFVKGFFQTLGVPDAVFVVIVSGVLDEFHKLKELPFMILVTEMCPKGCEGSLMAFLMSSVALANIVSRFLGVGLSWYMGVSATDFSGLPMALSIQAACTVLPLWWSSWIPDIHINGMPAGRNKQD